jgi:hypothetical protein
MRSSFIRRDRLAERKAQEGSERDHPEPSAAGKRAEARLLAITGDIARDSFPEVEERSGPVFGRQAEAKLSKPKAPRL